MGKSISGNARPAACTGPPKRPTQAAGLAGPSFVLTMRFGSDQQGKWQGIGSCGRSVEAAEEEVLSMEENDFGNVRPVACTGPPKRPAQTAGHAGHSFVQRFGSDQQGISNCRRSVEAAEEEVLTMGKSISGNVRPAACTGPPRRPAQTASYAGPSDVLRFASDQRGIASNRMSVEAAEEEEQCMEGNIPGNVRPVACAGPPKRPTQTAGHAGPPDVLCFASDQRGISSCRMSVEAAEEEVQCMERNIPGNVRPVACAGPPKRPTQTAGHAGPPDVLCFASDQWGISSYRMSVEAAEEEVQCMERSIPGNVRPVACAGPPKRPAQTAGRAGPSDVLHFASDQRGIASCRMSVEVAQEEIQCMEENDFGNVTPAACTGPPNRPTQIAGHAGVRQWVQLVWQHCYRM